MKKIFLALALVGLTQYSANAIPKNNCTCSTAKHTHKTMVHKVKKTATAKKSSGQVFMTTNSGKYMPYTNYAVYGRVHMSNRVVCTSKKDLQPDVFSGVMAPVVTPTTTTVCEDQAYITKTPLVHQAVYTTRTTTVNKNSNNKNSSAQPCAYKKNNVRVFYCLQ